MAEQKVESLSKTFHNVAFPEVADKFDVDIVYDSDTESIALKFVNKSNINIQTFHQIFTKDTVQQITDNCVISPHALCEVLMDNLSSSDFITRYCRLFVLSNTEQAIAKSKEFSAMKTIPNTIGIIEGIEEHKNEKENKCGLFTVHFSPSRWVHCNYCFVLKETNVSDADKFLIKFNELKEENGSLKERITQLEQTVNELLQTVQRLPAVNETKEEEIDLVLQNNWVHFGSGYMTPKATKTKSTVCLKGLVKSGIGTIATLPEGWRPKGGRRIFCQNQGTTSARVDVLTDGQIHLQSAYQTGWLPLDGICFTI